MHRIAPAGRDTPLPSYSKKAASPSRRGSAFPSGRTPLEPHRQLPFHSKGFYCELCGVDARLGNPWITGIGHQVDWNRLSKVHPRTGLYLPVFSDLKWVDTLELRCISLHFGPAPASA